MAKKKTFFTPEMVKKLERRSKEMDEGKSFTVRNVEELKQLEQSTRPKKS